MGLGDHEEGHGSLVAQSQIWSHMYSFIKSMSLKCAVELRIPEAIHKHGGQPVTLSQLVSALGVPPSKEPFLRRLMRLLTHSGYFIVQRVDNREEAYLLTKYSEYLLWDNPRSLAPHLVLELGPFILAPWQSLSEWFQGDSPTAFSHLHSSSLWEMASQTPALNDLLNDCMARDSRVTMDVVIKEHSEVFRGLKTLLDVGGGNGTTATVLAESFPQLKCSVLDLPHVVASTPKNATVDIIPGDMFEYIPRADAILLKMILHDWRDEQCVKLLKRCKEAVPPKEEGGKVIIVDMVVRDDQPRPEWTETQYFFDLAMMVWTDGGKERDQEEWQGLFSDAGFSGHKITPLGPGLRSIIELFP